MPLQPGEVSLLTLFADIHYYFSAPNAKPIHERFDKASYVYLYHDAINKRGRLEVANHAGTADQDAFQGFLDRSIVEHSSKHPTLVTIIAEAQNPPSGTAAHPPDASHWQLPGFDLRHETKYMYKLNTIDLYFWKADDAVHFLDSLRRCIQSQQIKSLDSLKAHSEHRDSMSPVVQQLEKAAITTPGYVERTNSVSTAQSSTAPNNRQTPVSPLAGSPVPAPAGIAEAPGNYAPLAYNPAAPGVPEPIAHREKTPPPPDAASGTGLAHAAVHEQGAASYGAHPGLQHQQSSGYGAHTPQQYGMSTPQQGSVPPPPPPTQAHRTNSSGSFPPPPPQQGSPYQPMQPGMQRQSTMPGQQVPQPSSPPAHQQSFSPQPTQQYANYHAGALHQSPASPGFHPPPPPSSQPSFQYGQPGTPGFASPPAQQQQPQAPIGGYSSYNYTQAGTGAQQQQQQQQQQDPYSIHQQVYRPTEGEAAHAHGSQHLVAGRPAQAGPGQQPGKFEQKLEKYEKGFSKFIKRFDK